MIKKLAPFLFLSAVAAAVLAQNFAIPSFTVDGGGGTSSGGTFSVSGTIGQPDAAPVSAGGTFAVTGGFWSALQLVQTPEAPVLAFRGTGGTVQVFWPANAPGWILQTSPSMAAGTWTDVSGAPAVSGPDQFHSFVITGTARLFFRLRPQQP